MLVLTRKLAERLRIGNHIEIQILGISKNQVRLGFTAPKDIPIHREEIWLKIRSIQESV